MEHPKLNNQLSGVTEGSSQMNTWPATQMSPGPLGAESAERTLSGHDENVEASSLKQMYVTVGRDRLCLIL